jgi:hypothetical protein
MRKHLDEMVSLIDANLLGKDEHPSMHEEESRGVPRERASEDRRRARGRDTDPPIVHPESEQNRGPGTAEDDEHDEHEDFVVDFLRERGFGEDAIRAAVDDYHKAKGRDRLPERVDVQDRAKDKMPARAGHFSRPRFSRDHEIADMDKIVDHGLDRDAELINGNRELMSRISHEPEASDRRRRPAMDTKLGKTEAQRERTFKRFPEMRRLDVA